MRVRRIFVALLLGTTTDVITATEPAAVSSPIFTATAAVPANAGELNIGFEGDEAFADDAMIGTDDEVVSHGIVADKFKCGSPTAMDRKDIGMRTLQAHRVSQPAGDTSFFGVAESSAADSSSFLTFANVRVQAVNADQGKEANQLKVLDVSVSPDTTEEKLRLGAADGEKLDLVVLYECMRAGKSVIELRYSLGEEKGAVSHQDTGLGDRRLAQEKSSEICISWIKECAVGWGSFQIEDDSDDLEQLPIFAGGVTRADWHKGMGQDGTKQATTQFKIQTVGNVVLALPEITSNQKLLDVRVLGPFMFGDQYLVVGKEGITLTAHYTCNYDGFADVTLLLRKKSIGTEEEVNWYKGFLSLGSNADPNSIQLTWRKHCGVEEFTQLQVFVKSEAYKNWTQAVKSGGVLEGFHPPCPKKHPVHYEAAVKGCSARPPVLIVPNRDGTTTIQVVVEAGSGKEPSFQPAPDLSYDIKQMKAVVQMPSFQRGRSSSSSTSKKKVYNFVVRYTCFKTTVTPIMMTLHVLGHKSMDVTWRKRCKQPVKHVSTALTAPQATTLAVFTCAVVGAICFVFCRGQSSSAATSGGSKTKVAATIGAGATAAELQRAGSTAGTTGTVGKDGVVHYS